MGHDKHAKTMDTSLHEETVIKMEAAHERVEEHAEQRWQESNTLDPLVDPKTGKIRKSHNVMKELPGKQWELVLGPALSEATFYDATRSMDVNRVLAHKALGQLYSMQTTLLSARYNLQIATGLFQDVDDPYPVVNYSEYESDNRIADHMRLLLPAVKGGDDPEDAQLAMFALLHLTDTDIHELYGLKGYAFFVGDQIARDYVTRSDVRKHLGDYLSNQLQGESIRIDEVCRQLMEKWHVFIVQVGSGGGAYWNSVSRWWADCLDPKHVVVVSDPNALAEVQTGLVYACETAQPSLEGFRKILAAGQNRSRVSAEEVWGWIIEANNRARGGKESTEFFGAQTRLTGYSDLPKIGSVFAGLRDPWPIDHSRTSENPSSGAVPKPEPTRTRKTTDWSKFK